MNGRLAAAGTAVGLAAGSALVVVPSASVRVSGAARPVSATARLRLDEAGARSFSVGPLVTEVSVPASGVLPATPATGSVVIQYDQVAALSFFGGFFECFFTLEPGYCNPNSPPAPKRLRLPAGTRLTGCAPPIAEAPAPPCPHPMALVTTAPAELVLGTYSGPIPVRTVAAGPSGNLLTDIWLADRTRFNDYHPHVGVAVRLDGAMQGGGEAGRPGVVQADLDRAAATARARLSGMATAAASNWLRPGETLATPLQDASVDVRPASARAGDVASTVSLSASIQGRAMAVPDRALARAATAALVRVAGDRHLLAGSVRWDPPQLDPGDPGSLLVTAHGLATVLDSYTVRSAAAWHGAGNVAAVVHRFDPRATVTVSGRFGWSPALVFLDRRVGVVVDGYALN